MSLKTLTAKMRHALNHIAPGSIREAQLGDRLKTLETSGFLAHDFAGAHADKTFTADEIPITPIVGISLTNANDAANVIVPPITGKGYMIVNASGAAITVKAAGKVGVAVANGKTAILRGNGEDLVRVTTDA